MPLENSLNANPYFDDYTPENEYYRILFKPGVAVQTRELNQVQSIIQNQIEKFGNHVFKSGTIVSGVNFNYLPSYPFVKITDTQSDGQPSLPVSYVDYFVKSNLNLTARVINYKDGLESSAPDLNTLYLQYNNSSNPDTSNSSAVYTTFGPDQQLTVFAPDYPLFKITVNNGGLGFSNSDTVVFTSAISLSNISGAFTNGQVITQSTTGAKALIRAINTTAVADTTILQISPRNVDLTNNSVNSTSWAMTSAYSIVSDGGATANISSVIGSGATALLSTDSQGILQTVTIGNDGSGYTFLPWVTVKTSNSTATVQNLDLLPQNFKTKITVANTGTTPVGTGYAFGVSEGTIYQKGFFLKVDPQIIIVDKYSSSPTNAAVGFTTVETYVDSNADETLFDNASNTTNYTAPGADRLKLTPTLTLLTSSAAAANIDFFTLAEWKEGFPFKENRVTVYSNLGDEFARRTREAQGNFVVDPFEVATKEKSTANVGFVQAVIDPGLAYIGGYRTSTSYNNYLDVGRSNTVTSIESQKITASYGNYVLVKELAGLFDFKTGPVVSFYDTAKTFLTSRTISTTGAITPTGNLIGTARIRSLILDTGVPGTASCTYRMYLFDVQMSAGRAFREVRSVYYDGSVQDGIADINLVYDATTAANVAQLVDTFKDQIVFPVGKGGVKTITNVVYTYRTVSDATTQIQVNGTYTTGTLGSGLTFPYGDGTLTTTQKKDFILFPVANAQASVAASGGANVTVTNASNVVVSSGGSSFSSEFEPGDWIKFANSGVSGIYQVSAVTNTSHMVLSTTASADIANAQATLFFPSLYPINFDRSNRTITISGSSKTAALSVGNTLTGTVNAIVVYNVTSTGATAQPRTITRDVFVKIHTSNNISSNTGPWSLGIPGPIRLKNVFLGNTTNVGTTANSTVSNVTKYFFINTGEDENALRISNLVLKSGSDLAVNTNQFILAQFDVFTSGPGFATVASYTINDTANLASSAGSINTLEIPELVTSKGVYFDMRNTFDFRPFGSNTATRSTSDATANVNPLGTFGLSADDKLFPLPDSTITFNAEYYNSRVDRVIVRKDSSFEVIRGTPALINPVAPPEPAETVTLSVISVPSYPSLPAAFNTQTSEFASKQVGSATGPINARLTTLKIKTRNTLGDRQHQPRRYTMADIGKLDQRISDIEYQVTLSGLESSVKDLSIPSSITPTTNRFKNGFFIEPFNDYSKTAVSNREFSATIDQSGSLLRPPVKQVNFESDFDLTDGVTAAAVVNQDTLMLPFQETILIDQSIKSTILGSDGHAIAFVGEGTISPASFSIQTRGEVTITQEAPQPQFGSGTATPIVADAAPYESLWPSVGQF